MLQFIRDRATGWIAWGIVILISIPFAVWGVHNYLSDASAVGAAQVNGTDITLREYQRTFQRQQMQLREALGNKYDAAAEERLRGVVLDRLIDEEVIDQAAHAAGMRIGDAQLALAIQSQQAFQSDGKFSQAQYETWLRRQGYSSSSFEYDFRRSLLSEQLANGVRWSAMVTDGELDRMVALASQRRHYATLLVSAAPFEKPDAIDEKAVRARYDANPENYRSKEQVKVAYVEVSRDAIAAGISVPDSELHALYESQKANYTRPEQREVSHILITVPPDADDATVAAARKRIEALRARIVAGAGFAKVARESSEDPGSAPQGGDLGAIERGMMDAAFEKVAFSLKVGVVSEPVRTRFGWHLIEVRSIEPSKIRPFDEVRESLLEEARRREADSEFADQVDRLANLTYENPESLEPAADALGIKVRESSFFARDGSGAEGIVAEPGVIKAAFSPDVLAGNNSEPIEFDEPRVLVLRVIEHRESKTLPFEKVADQIRGELAAESAAREAGVTAAQLLDQLETGADPAALAKSQGLEWSADATGTRGDSKIEADLRDLLFRMPEPDATGARYDALQRSNGDVVIVALKGVENGAPLDDKTRQQAARSLAMRYGGDAFNADVELLRSRATIKRFEENLQ